MTCLRLHLGWARAGELLCGAEATSVLVPLARPALTPSTKSPWQADGTVLSGGH